MTGAPRAADVARAAGCSISAVSRAFTPGGVISSVMRARVIAAADRLGYRPNAIARSLITGRSRTIGLVIAYLENLLYPSALELLARGLQQRGHHVLLFFAPQEDDRLDAVLAESLDRKVEGLILASVALGSTFAARCAAEGVPTVHFNRIQDDGAPSVASDNRAGGRRLGEYLIRGGHRRIAYIAGWPGSSTQRDREAGLVDALSAAGLDLFDREPGDFRAERAAQATRALLDRKERPDAIFVANDHMAFAAMDVARFEFGLAIPGDLSIVGFDDVPQAAWRAYDLTTARQDLAAMARATIDVLFARIEGEAVPLRRTIDAPLVARGSARRPRETLP